MHSGQIGISRVYFCALVKIATREKSERHCSFHAWNTFQRSLIPHSDMCFKVAAREQEISQFQPFPRTPSPGPPPLGALK